MADSVVRRAAAYTVSVETARPKFDGGHLQPSCPFPVPIYMGVGSEGRRASERDRVRCQGVRTIEEEEEQIGSHKSPMDDLPDIYAIPR